MVAARTTIDGDVFTNNVLWLSAKVLNTEADRQADRNLAFGTR